VPADDISLQPFRSLYAVNVGAVEGNVDLDDSCCTGQILNGKSSAATRLGVGCYE